MATMATKSQFSGEAIFCAGATVIGSVLFVFPNKFHQQIWLEFKGFFSRRCQGVTASVVKFSRAEKSSNSAFFVVARLLIPTEQRRLTRVIASSR